jgi:hypothetical protein
MILEVIPFSVNTSNETPGRHFNCIIKKDPETED